VFLGSRLEIQNTFVNHKLILITWSCWLCQYRN
jgi:hypothetical protein